MTVPVVALVVALPLLLGAALQRTAGLGLALVAAPFLVAALGARDGVSFGNTLQIALCALVLVRTWRGVRWRAAGLLLLGAAVGVPLGALVVTTAPEAPLLVVVGSLALAGVLLSLAPTAGAALRGAGGATAAGVAAGLVNATAGVGGPLVSAYATSQRWPREVFVPTAQVVLLAINAGALAAKGLPDPGGLVWAAGVAAIVVGSLVGGPVSRHLGPVAGRRLVLVVALAGALATIVRGLVEL